MSTPLSVNLMARARAIRLPHSLEPFETPIYLLLLLVTTVASWYVAGRLWKLRDVPGPVPCKLTDLYRASIVRTGKSHEIHQAFHDRYGPVVRLGPNMVSVSDPAAIPTIYPLRPGFPKSAFYDAFIPYTKGGSAPAIFTARDESLHKQLKSPVAPLYSLSNVLKCEHFVDEVLTILMDKLDDEFGRSRKTFDLGDWLQYFAFDAMGTMTFSETYGFLEDGGDTKGLLGTIWKFMLTVGPLTQVPWLDKILNKNRVAAAFKKASGNVILQIAGEHVKKRKAATHGGGNNGNKFRADFLSKFLKIEEESPGIPPWSPLVWTFSNIIAGSDSTAVVMKTTMYHVLAHERSTSRLREELTQQENLNGLARPFPTWHDVSSLPYLDACVNEAVRLHPPFSLALERVVPDGGITVCGKYLEAGTCVGMNPYVVNRHQGTFGDDADDWRPERWLEGDEEHRRILAQSIMTFGAGRRVCLGKHVAILEIKKIVSALVLNYRFDLVDPGAYVVENSYFFRQRGIMVKVQRRNDSCWRG